MEVVLINLDQQMNGSHHQNPQLCCASPCTHACVCARTDPRPGTPGAQPQAGHVNGKAVGGALLVWGWEVARYMSM